MAAECKLALLAVTQHEPSATPWLWQQPRRAAERAGLAGAVVTDRTVHVPLTEQEAHSTRSQAGYSRPERSAAVTGRWWATLLGIHAGTLPGTRQLVRTGHAAMPELRGTSRRQRMNW